MILVGHTSIFTMYDVISLITYKLETVSSIPRQAAADAEPKAMGSASPTAAEKARATAGTA